MISSLNAELKKLLTVRSTYLIVLIALLIAALFAGYGDGFKADLGRLQSPGYLVSESSNAVLFDGIILALAGLLLLAHEYRYNTILYTITSSNSRIKTLLAKTVVVSMYALVVTAVLTFFSPLCAIVGTHLAHKDMAAQIYPAWTVLGKCLFVGWGYAMFGFILTAIIRSQVGSIVTFLLIPLIGEHIIGAIFSSSIKYLPFTSLQSVVDTEMPKVSSSISLTHNVVTSCVYVGVGLLVSFILFARRDAN